MINSRGYTLIELVVAVGLFALVMMLVSGAYLMMIAVTQQAQGTATGIDNLSFALETMTRTIRTGTDYRCGGSGDCASGASSFSFTDANGTTVTYEVSETTIQQTKGGVQSILTDPSVSISSLLFYVSGTAPLSMGDTTQPHVTMTVSGTVSPGPGKPPQSFAIQTGATMRGSDLGVFSCTPLPGSPVPTPSVDEDCNGDFDNSVESGWVYQYIGYVSGSYFPNTAILSTCLNYCSAAGKTWCSHHAASTGCTGGNSGSPDASNYEVYHRSTTYY